MTVLLGSFFKVKVQNDNIFEGVCYMSLSISRVCLIFW